MQIKEQKIATFTTKEGKRIQLLEINKPTKKIYFHIETNSYDNCIHMYEIRINRKIYKSKIHTKDIARKYLCSLLIEELLQTKLTF